MKKALSFLLSVLLVISALPMMFIIPSSAEDTVQLRNYTNIALNKPVRSGNDSSFKSGSVVTDGQTGSYVDINWTDNFYSDRKLNDNCYVIIDLGDVYDVNGITVQNYASSSRYYRWKAYASVDQENWTLIAEKNSSAPSIAGGYYFETPVTSAQYIKVVGTYGSANGGYHFVEVKVYSPDEYTLGDTVASTYTADGCEATLAADGTLTLSGAGAIGNDSSAASDYPWYAVRTAIKKVIVEDGITSIGANAFAECAALHTVYLKGETTLGDNIFANANVTKLESDKIYYTDLYADVRGTANENKIRQVLEETYGGVQWKLLDNGTTLYIYGTGALTYESRDLVPWFQNTAGRGNYQKVVIGDAITDIGKYSFSADAYGKLSEIVLGASMQQFKYQSMAYIPLAKLTFLAPITYYGHDTTTGNKYSGTLEVTIASGQTSEDLIAKEDGYAPGEKNHGNSKLWEANFTNVEKRHVKWIDDTTGKTVFACYVADGQTPVFGAENIYVYNGVTYEFDIPQTEAVTEDKVYHLSSHGLTNFTIQWVKEGTGEVLYTETVASGLTPVYAGVTRLEMDGNVYIATGIPAAEPAYADATYTVSFTQLPKYTITWVNGQTGETIYETQVSETLMPVFGGVMPESYTEDGVSYEPVSPRVSAATEDATYIFYYNASYGYSAYAPSDLVWQLLDDEKTLYVNKTGVLTADDAAAWASYKNTIEKVIIGDNITEISDRVFENSAALVEIVLGASCSRFTYRAFASCPNLEYMTFLSDISYFGHQIFAGNTKQMKLTTVKQNVADIFEGQAYGPQQMGVGNDQLRGASLTIASRIIAKFIDGRTGETLFITSLASGTVPYYPVALPEAYVENGITYTPVLPTLETITDSTVYTITYVPDHAHTGDWTVTKEATFEEAGEKTRTCTICGCTETVEIPKTTLGAHTSPIVGNADGKNTITFIGSVVGEALDYSSLEKLTLTLEFEQDGTVVRTISNDFNNIYTTIKNIVTTEGMTMATISKTTAAVDDSVISVEGNSIFALQINGIPAGEYTVKLTASAMNNGETLSSYSTVYSVTVG